MSGYPTAATSRRLAHTRQITCTGYVREDGLYDIEAQMTDTKAHHSDLLFKQVPAGGAIHDMWLRITVNAGFVIVDACARTQTAPTPFCAEINEAYAKLVGIRIGRGFVKEVRARVGGVSGCTHLNELLGPMATTAFQTIMGLRNNGQAGKEPHGDNATVLPMLDSCHAWRAEGEVIRVVRQHAGAHPASRTTVQPVDSNDV